MGFLTGFLTGAANKANDLIDAGREADYEEQKETKRVQQTALLRQMENGVESYEKQSGVVAKSARAYQTALQAVGGDHALATQAMGLYDSGVALDSAINTITNGRDPNKPAGPSGEDTYTGSLYGSLKQQHAALGARAAQLPPGLGGVYNVQPPTAPSPTQYDPKVGFTAKPDQEKNPDQKMFDFYLQHQDDYLPNPAQRQKFIDTFNQTGKVDHSIATPGSVVAEQSNRRAKSAGTSITNIIGGANEKGLEEGEKDNAKWVSGLSKEVGVARDQVNVIQQLRVLQGQIGQGGPVEPIVQTIRGIARPLGLLDKNQENKLNAGEAYASLSDILGAMNHSLIPGPVSNSDRDWLTNLGPSIRNSPGAIEIKLDMLERRAKQKFLMQDTAEKYVQERINRGLTGELAYFGVQSHVQRVLDANPMYTPEEIKGVAAKFQAGRNLDYANYIRPKNDKVQQMPDGSVWIMSNKLGPNGMPLGAKIEAPK